MSGERWSSARVAGLLDGYATFGGGLLQLGFHCSTSVGPRHLRRGQWQSSPSGCRLPTQAFSAVAASFAVAASLMNVVSSAFVCSTVSYFLCLIVGLSSP
jgi:hypothetical protein